MALTTSLLPSIYPVYTNHLILNAVDSTAGNLYVYQCLIYVNDILTDTLNYPANPVAPFDININLSTILIQKFTSSVFTGITTNTFQAIPNSITKYRVDINMFSGSTSTGVNATTGDKYLFNGCENNEDVFNMNDFIFNGANTSYFLTDFHTQREIALTDKAYLNTILGNYTTIASDFGGLYITRYQNDGTTSGISIANTVNNTTKCILSIDVSPSNINTYSSNFLNSNTLYYTIEEITHRNKVIMKVSFPEEKKILQFYNFNYVNRLGGVDFFTATSSDSNKFKITKSTLDQYLVQKVYGTEVNRETNVLTQFLTVYQTESMKELFTSLAVKVWLNNKMNDIQIINTDINVRSKYPKTDLIQYTITFRYLYKYFTQIY